MRHVISVSKQAQTRYDLDGPAIKPEPDRSEFSTMPMKRGAKSPKPANPKKKNMAKGGTVTTEAKTPKKEPKGGLFGRGGKVRDIAGVPYEGDAADYADGGKYA